MSIVLLYFRVFTHLCEHIVHPMYDYCCAMWCIARSSSFGSVDDKISFFIREFLCTVWQLYRFLWEEDQESAWIGSFMAVAINSDIESAIIWKGVVDNLRNIWSSRNRWTCNQNALGLGKGTKAWIQPTERRRWCDRLAEPKGIVTAMVEGLWNFWTFRRTGDRGGSLSFSHCNQSTPPHSWIRASIEYGQSELYSEQAVDHHHRPQFSPVSRFWTGIQSGRSELYSHQAVVTG